MPPPPAPAIASFAEPRAAAGTNGSPDSALVAAFLEGMGFPDARLSPTEYGRLMREAGATVRAMAAGLILLLSARRMVKSEFRMDETQVQPEENNPFKFFKVAELALDEMFLTRAGGYQAPAEAARSAFEDLEQHTMLTMSAMQRAIKLIFDRLSPEALTREADDGGGLRIRGLTARKGKLEAFTENHEKMSRNIDAVARQTIAEAFAQVQEEHARQRSREHWGNKP
jgi:type VI secretion system FHA domain protein